MADLTTKQLYTFGDSLYLLSTSDTWGTAQTEAQSFQGNLVTINNEAEQTFLTGLFAGKELWIGYSDSGIEGTFAWANGESSAYTNWGTNEPNDQWGSEDFATLTGNGDWNDRPGSQIRQGIIEIKNPLTPILAIEDLGIIEPANGTKQAVFTVRRYGSSNFTTVNYSTTDGTALAGTHYTATSGTLTFNPGETVKTIAVTVAPDADTISRETFFVNLSSPTNAILGDNQAKATIRETTEAATFGGSTYLLTNPGNWGEAQQQARAFGGNLVTINTAQEQTFLAGKYTGQNLWIGYSDAGKEWNVTTGEGFQWVSGTSAYTNWAVNEPNDQWGAEDFATLTSNGSWNDRPGSESYRGIIEVPYVINLDSPAPSGNPGSNTSTGSNSNDTLTGTSNDDTLIGNGGNNILVCSKGKDTLTGGIGADRFLYSGNSQNAALQKSSVTVLDRITDFNAVQGDRIWLDFDDNRNTVQLPKNLFNAKDVTGKTLTDAVKSAYADKNYKLRGKQALNAKEAVFFEWQNHTYLSVNDTRRQFTSSRDLVIDVTGIQMFAQDTVSGAIAVSKYFT